MASTTSLSAMPTQTAICMAQSCGMHSKNSCKISMLWNWHTLDACFLTRSWRIRSTAGFAGTCLIVVLMVLFLEALRRVSAEYDANLTQPRRAASPTASSAPNPRKAEGTTDDEDEAASSADGAANPTAPRSTPPSPSRSSVPAKAVMFATGRALATTAASPARNTRRDVVAQTMRALLHTLQFAVAYFVMLLAMYYNGYILLCIFVGAFLGAFLFGRGQGAREEGEVTVCCG